MEAPKILNRDFKLPHVSKPQMMLVDREFVRGEDSKDCDDTKKKSTVNSSLVPKTCLTWMNDEMMLRVVPSPHADLDFAFYNCLWYEKNWITSLCKRKTLDTHVLLPENHSRSSCFWIDSAILWFKKKRVLITKHQAMSSHAPLCLSKPNNAPRSSASSSRKQLHGNRRHITLM